MFIDFSSHCAAAARFLAAAVVVFIANTVARAGELPPTTTILSHGFTTGSKGDWVQAMGEAILVRAGEGSLYRYQGATGAWTYVPTAAGDGTNNTIVLIYNWVPESASPSPGPNLNYVQAAGDVLYAMLRSPRYAGSPPTSPPNDLVTDRHLHFIGHSRGACVHSEAVKRFALANIAVDHYTGLDPHPVNGTLDSPFNPDWGDPTPRKWNNIVFADNFWRADGGGFINGLDFDGISIPDAFNTQLSETALNCCADSLAHLDVHTWYYGTIDTGPNANDGDYDITPTMRNTWYPPGPPIGYTERGFYYSRIGGAAAIRPANGPGVGPLSDGATETIFNGNFNGATYAGWGYHGGSVNGTITTETGNGYLRLGAGAGNGAGNATHNVFYLPRNAAALALDYRVYTANANEQLRITLRDAATGSEFVVGSLALAAVSGWNANHQLALTCASAGGPPRGRGYFLGLQIISPGAIASVVGIDNLRYTTADLPADVNGDGVVGVPDLLAVISAWGACTAPCPAPAYSTQACAADVNSDCTVGVPDLLGVISAWAACR